MTMAVPPDYSALVAALPSLRRFARSLTRASPIDADDLVQATALLAMERWHLFRPGDRRAWLTTILYHQHVNMLRADRSAKRIALAQLSASGSAIGDPAIGLIVRDAARAIRALPTQAQALRLVGLYGHRYDRAAEILGTTTNTIRSRLGHGRAALRAADIL